MGMVYDWKKPLHFLYFVLRLLCGMQKTRRGEKKKGIAIVRNEYLDTLSLSLSIIINKINVLNYKLLRCFSKAKKNRNNQQTYRYVLKLFGY